MCNPKQKPSPIFFYGPEQTKPSLVCKLVHTLKELFPKSFILALMLRINSKRCGNSSQKKKTYSKCKMEKKSFTSKLCFGCPLNSLIAKQTLWSKWSAKSLCKMTNCKTLTTILYVCPQPPDFKSHVGLICCKKSPLKRNEFNISRKKNLCRSSFYNRFSMHVN